MKFKQIDIFGFKSFANKIEVKIDDGVIAIIGPNGCGKSNFADAIRWVLGEQSPKTLRGGSMQDVIFSGTETKKSLSYCEVTLSFSEIEEEDIPYSELSISRRLTRAGDSNYFINNQKVKLRDVSDLIRKLKIGKDGYSIIGQGKVEEIISSKPLDRRKIFEEATGIAEARENKTLAEKKLATTKDNLFNLSNVIAEIEKRLELLEKDAVKAEKYLSIRDELRFNEINLYFHEKDAVDKKVNDLTTKLNGANDELNLRNEDKNRLNEKNIKLNNDTVDIENKIRDLTDIKLNLSVNNQKVLGDLSKLEQQVSFLETQAEELRKTEAECKGYIAEYEEKVKTYLEEKETLEQDRDKYIVEFDELEKKHAEISRELQSYNSELKSSRDKIFESINKLSDIKSNLSEYKTKKLLLEDTLRKDSEKLEGLKQEVKEKEEKLLKFKNDNSSSFNEYNTLTEKQNTYQNKQNALNSELNSVNTKYYDSNNKIVNYETQYKMMKEMVNSYDGFVYSVKSLIKDAESNAPLKTKIAGVVANCMKVPEKYEVAISTALGQAVQNIISPTKETANYLINYLKEKRYGRATFLPMDSYKARELDNRYQRLLNTSGCFGVACDLIEFERKYDNIYKGLLGNTVIVDTMQTAIKMSKEADINFKIVTLDGDVMNPTGAMTGGSRKSNDNTLISYKRTIKELEEKIVNERNVLEEMSLKKKNLTRELDEVNAKLNQVNKEISLISVEISKNDVILKNQENEINTLNTEKGRLEENINSTTMIVDELANAIKSIEGTSTSIESDRESANNEISKREERSRELNEQYNKVSNELMLVRTSLASAKERISSLTDNISNSQFQIKTYTERYDETVKKLQDNEFIIENAKNELLTKNLSQEELEKVKETEEEIELLEKTKELYREELNKNNIDIERNNEQINDLNAKIIRWEGQMETIQSSFASMSEEIKTKYENLFDNFGLGVNSFYVEEFDIEEGKAKIKTFKRQLSAMGDINLKAADDLKAERKRYDEYITQRQDIESSMEDTKAMLERITIEMTTKFNAGFEQIQNNFSKIFRELFGGGKARLILEPSETGDPLDEGIDIEATPPGKSPKRISLLSGGEKALTAISILFSILTLRAMPFCVLDEIEAALDEANVERFARYLRNFSKYTQFIVITHRKPTMQLADSLYGVTMESGSGVSKVLSVSLKEAEGYVEDEPKKEKED